MQGFEPRPGSFALSLPEDGLGLQNLLSLSRKPGAHFAADFRANKLTDEGC